MILHHRNSSMQRYRTVLMLSILILGEDPGNSQETNKQKITCENDNFNGLSQNYEKILGSLNTYVDNTFNTPFLTRKTRDKNNKKQKEELENDKEKLKRLYPKTVQGIDQGRLNNSDRLLKETVYFNKVSKAGSATMVEIMRLLSARNNFTLFRARESKHAEYIRLNNEQQIQLTRLINHFSSPSIYVKHTGFLDFSRLNNPMPLYINMVRHPIERVISMYYYIRSPWYIVSRKKKFPDLPLPEREWILQDFETCVNKQLPECVYIEGAQRNDMSQLTEFFCGQEEYCSGFNTEAALKSAKDNVEKHYAVIGILEDLNKTLSVFEDYIPRFFKGALDIYLHELAELKEHKNIYRPPVSKTAKDIVSKNFTRELEFYEFCKQRLHQQYLGVHKEKQFFQEESK